MLYFFAIFCILIMFSALLLIVFGLPGTWVIIGTLAGWTFFVPSENIGWQFFAYLILAAFIAEVVEFAASYFGTKKFGGSSKGSFGGIVGALVGAIFFAPLFFGFGAVLGAVGGAFVGCFCVEKLRKVNTKVAARAAFGTALGRFGGFIIKIGTAVVMLWYTVPAVWQSIKI